jgi:pimeloyl-ACP methyl ester carboxylesterase
MSKQASQQEISLILLPGMDGIGDLFAPFVQALQANSQYKKIKTIVVNYPTNEVLSYVQLIQLVSAHIPSNQPYILLGESFSGPIAILLAAKADSQLKGIILSCTFARNPRPQLSKLSFMLPTLPINEMIMPFANKFLMANFSDENVAKMLFTAIQKVSPNVMRARLDAVINVDYTESLQKIKVPILYLQGKSDYLVPSSAGKYIVEQVKNVELIALNAPHLLLQIAAKEAAEKVQSFIKKITLEALTN